MELTKAIEILETLKKSVKDEHDALELAITSLKGQFAPQLTVLETARAQVEEAQAALEHKDAVIAEKDIALQEVSSAKEELEARVAELEATPDVVVEEAQVIA